MIEDTLMNYTELVVENWTPHAITLKNGWGTTTYEPSGNEARLEKENQIVGDIDMFTVSRQVVTGHNLPEPQPNKILIVSAMILAAFPERQDLVAPDTNNATRDAKGNIVSVPGFICN